LRGANNEIAGVYVHVPFCVHKCHYCDFYSIVDGLGKADAYVDRLLEECAAAVEGGLANHPITTIFVGGGTPTLLPPRALERLLGGLSPLLGGRQDREWTVEANPETVTPEIAGVLADAGVTRVSIGSQSFQPALLKRLERLHDPASVGRAVAAIKAAGITSFNIDMIFGIPSETMAELEADLAAVAAIDPPHLSWYGLIYEPGTPLAVRLSRGEVQAVEESLEAAMYERICQWSRERGYDQYEISAFCRAGEACRHNLCYWQDGSYWPLGPAAAGHVGSMRWRNVRHLGRYMDSSGLGPIEQVIDGDDDTAVGEALMMGLRLRAGIPADRIESLLARGSRGDQRRAIIAAACAREHLAWQDGALVLTDAGILIADSIIIDLL
jgi:oxygen-independent coproporphyrinogen-3 oxidase